MSFGLGSIVTLVLSAAWLVAVAWLVLRALNQSRLLPPLPMMTPDCPVAGIAVIVPARNEEANIGPCLTGLAQQTYPSDRLEIVVVDDNSSDRTAEIVETLAAQYPAIRLLRSPALPPGWTGKTHACWIGASAASEGADWLCFLDADMRAEPGLLASAMQAAEAERLDLLSLAPRQQLVSFAERLTMPCGLYALAFCQDLARLQAPDSSDATATGQFMLLRRDGYTHVGGYSAVRSIISEDVALARLMKRSGYRVVLKDGSRLLSTRMYTGWQTLWPGLAKNLIDMLGGPVATVVISIAAVVLAWAAVLLPVWDAVRCWQGSEIACIALVPALMASAAAFGLHIAGAVHFRIPAWYGLLFPFGYTVGAAMALDSIRQRLTGRVSWKGRTYP